MPAKLALAQIIRAIKKRDYLILTSDAIPEIDQIKTVAPEIMQYADDIKEIRSIQKSIFSRRFKNRRCDSSSDGERPLFTLP